MAKALLQIFIIFKSILVQHIQYVKQFLVSVIIPPLHTFVEWLHCKEWATQSTVLAPRAFIQFKVLFFFSEIMFLFCAKSPLCVFACGRMKSPGNPTLLPGKTNVSILDDSAKCSLQKVVFVPSAKFG